MSITRIGIAQGVAGIDSNLRRTDTPPRASTTNEVPKESVRAAPEPAGGREPVAPEVRAGQLKATVKLPDIPLRELSMTLDPEANRVVIKVIDSETKDVLRQIPPTEALELLRDLPGVRGLLLNKKG